jgi:hypothetical protein
MKADDFLANINHIRTTWPYEAGDRGAMAGSRHTNWQSRASGRYRKRRTLAGK